MKFLLASFLLILAACNKNPYPDDGIVTVTPPAVPEAVATPITADVPADGFVFKEGEEREFTIKAVVPSPGLPEVKIENLPEGATFDPKTFKLRWNPDYFSANDAKDPGVNRRKYPIIIWVRSTDTSASATRRARMFMANIYVDDNPRGVSVNAEDEMTVSENEVEVYEFSINNLDYPNGPFNVSLADFPINSVLEKVSDTTYKVKLSPDYQHVNVKRDTRCGNYYTACIVYKSKIVVSNPAGHRFEKDVKVKINDKRVGPKAVAVDQVEQGLDVNFQVGGYDLNSEITPTIELTSSKPQVGNFSLNFSSDLATYSTVAKISWIDLPPSLNGTSHTFNFKVCSLNANASYQNCVSKSVEVKIKIRERLAPVISRSSWSIGDMKFLNFKESASYRVDVIDAHDSRAPVKVEIFPESIRPNVSWSRNQLNVKFDKSGIFQFNVTATSQYGIKSIEGFVVEVFPETRGQVLLLSDSSRDKEVQFYRKHFKNLEVLNPFLQELGVRVLSGRHTLVVGTSVLTDPASMSSVEQATKAIKNIVIATPMVKNLPESLYRQITDDFRITVVGRYLDIPGIPALNEMSFVTRQDFTKPVAPLVLSQSATVESANPTIFSTGVDTKNCDDVLEVADALRLNRFKIGIICDRPNSGRLALLGTEWADLKAIDPADAEIASKWLNTMLMTGLNNINGDI